MDTIPIETQTSSIKKSIEDAEVERIDKKRKEFHQQAKQNTKDKVEYVELSKKWSETDQ